MSDAELEQIKARFMARMIAERWLSTVTVDLCLLIGEVDRLRASA